MRSFFRRLFRGRYGSYGTDKLTRFLLVLAVICLLTSILIISLDFMYYVAFILLIYCYYRLLSKNITKRYKENEVYTKVEHKIRSLFKFGKK